MTATVQGHPAFAGDDHALPLFIPERKSEILPWSLPIGRRSDPLEHGDET